MAEHSGGGPRDSAGDKAREEFFSEAQEIVDGLSRDLLALDEVCRRGGSDAELVNDIFRAVHTLKGLSGLFGAAMMSGLSHELENLLDDLRLGRIEVNAQVLDLLFQSVELYGRILQAAKGLEAEPATEVKQLLAALGTVAKGKGGAGSPMQEYELDPNLLGVLTEYEEHRLRTNIAAGLSLYRMRVQFQLATIDSALDALKAKTRPCGEIITFLPTGEGGDAESVELEILVASREPLSVLAHAVAGPNIAVEEVSRRRQQAGSSADAREHAAAAPLRRSELAVGAAAGSADRPRGRRRRRGEHSHLASAAARAVAPRANRLVPSAAAHAVDRSAAERDRASRSDAADGRRGASATNRARAHASFGHADGPRRHPQARSADEHRR